MHASLSTPGARAAYLHVSVRMPRSRNALDVLYDEEKRGERRSDGEGKEKGEREENRALGGEKCGMERS